MAYIKLNNTFPGIVGLLFHKPAIGTPLHALAHAALRGPSPLTPGERELIAAHVSNLNNCDFCRNSHSATASELLQDEGAAVACVIGGKIDDARLSPKMNALLDLAARVTASGKLVTIADIERARAAGATDDDIHDTVLVAALFCLLNRYVDGLGTESPTFQEFYGETSKALAKQGYRKPSRIARFFIERMMKKFAQSANPG
jgi:uncharacterized peroxidase-related enzyme